MAASGRCPAAAATRARRPPKPRCANWRKSSRCLSTPASVLGLLDDYPTRSGYVITPVVVWGGADPQVRINPNEVASVHRIPIAEIMRPDVAEFVTIPESDRRVIRLLINGGRVHAPTAAMIYQFREVLAGRATRVDQLEQPVFAWR